MINPIKRLSTLIKLLSVQRTINKYRVWGERKVKLEYKPLLKYPLVRVLYVKIDKTTCGLLVTSQRKKKSDVIYIEYVWVNRTSNAGILSDTTSSYFQLLFEIFMRWHYDFVQRPLMKKRSLKPSGDTYTVAISINVTENDQVELYRRILTLYGFNLNPSYTLQNATFLKPYREKEVIKNVVYTRTI